MVRQDTPEVVRIQYYIDRLIKDYGYPADCIKTEVPFSMGPNQYRADIVVYQKEKPFILIEVKSNLKNFNSKTSKKLALRSVILGTEYFVLTDSYIDHVLKIFKNNTLDPRLVDDIPTFEQKFNELKVLSKEDLIQIKDPDSFLRSLYDHIDSYQNEIGLRMSNVSMINEFYKVLFTKACDESSQKIEFVIDRDIKSVAKNIQRLYRLYRITDDKNSVINLPDKLIFELVKKLQKYSITESKFDSYSFSTERLTRLFTKQYGEFFTPRPIGELLVDLIPINQSMNVLDLACGTGYILSLVAKNQANFIGIDINSNMVDLARTIITMGGFKNGNIFLHNSLDTLEELNRISKNKIKPNSFDMIITHPPFGGILDKERIRHFTLSRFPGQKRMEWFFIERSWDLLKTGGKLLIIVPDSLLANESNRLIREYLMDRFRILGIISLQNFTHIFETNSKASILILEKSIHPTTSNYDIFYSIPKHAQGTGFAGLKEVSSLFKKFITLGNGDSISYSSIDESEMKRMDVDFFIGLKNLKKISIPSKELGSIADISIGTRQDRIKQGNNTFGYIKANNIKDFEIENVSELLNDKMLLERSILEEGDIVITRSGTVGNIALVKKQDEKKLIISDNIIRLRVVDKQIDSRYLTVFLASDMGQEQIKQQSTGTTIQGISITALSKIMIPMVSLSKQKRIASEFEHTLKIKQKMNQSISEYNSSKMFLSDIISKTVSKNGSKSS